MRKVGPNLQGLLTRRRDRESSVKVLGVRHAKSDFYTGPTPRQKLIGFVTCLRTTVFFNDSRERTKRGTTEGWDAPT